MSQKLKRRRMDHVVPMPGWLCRRRLAGSRARATNAQEFDSRVMRTLVDQQVLERIRAEYLEMPGLRLKADQVQRLCGVERELCKNVLDALVEREFLCLKLDGTYARLMDGDMTRPLPNRRWPN